MVTAWVILLTLTRRIPASRDAAVDRVLNETINQRAGLKTGPFCFPYYRDNGACANRQRRPFRQPINNPVVITGCNP
jgi:hypothetical protein